MSYATAPSRETRRAIAVCLNPRTSPPAADRILVVRLGAVGDVARTLPAAARELWTGLGVPTLVTHGPAPDDRRLAEAVVRAAPDAARLAPPTQTLAELAALLANARVAIGPDTGPLHLAALVGTPSVLLLGATDPVENAPWPGTPSRVLLASRTPSGALDLPADEVVAAARELLDAGAAPEAVGAAR